MKLVIGLGNPGGRYNFTRHNAGFLALDFYFKLRDLSWNEKPKFNAIWGRSGDIIFIKPQGFYNESGTVVKTFMQYYKIDIPDILVICDNFDLDFGKIRHRLTGTTGGNNGLKSITVALKSDNYPRIRIGTGNNELRRQLGDVEFVLSRFTPAEKSELPTILGLVSKEIDKLF